MRTTGVSWPNKTTSKRFTTTEGPVGKKDKQSADQKKQNKTIKKKKQAALMKTDSSDKKASECLFFFPFLSFQSTAMGRRSGDQSS